MLELQVNDIASSGAAVAAARVRQTETDVEVP